MELVVIVEESGGREAISSSQATGSFFSRICHLYQDLNLFTLIPLGKHSIKEHLHHLTLTEPAKSITGSLFIISLSKTTMLIQVTDLGHLMAI